MEKITIAKQIAESEELQTHIAQHLRKSITPILIQQIAEDACSKFLNNGGQYWPQIERVLINYSHTNEWIYLEDLKNSLPEIQISNVMLKRILISNDYQVVKHYGPKNKGAVFI